MEENSSDENNSTSSKKFKKTLLIITPLIIFIALFGSYLLKKNSKTPKIGEGISTEISPFNLLPTNSAPSSSELNDNATFNNSPTITTALSISETEVPASQNIDLKITDYQFDPYPVYENQEFKALITIQNIGKDDSDSFTWEWWPNINTYTCKENIENLKANEKIQVTCTHIYPIWAIYQTKAVIDNENDVPEYNKDNNIFTQSISVLKSKDN